jgi:3-hydroxybutyryl-CoA dehydrogenase
MPEATELRRIAIIGAGRLGLDFALRCVAYGLDVVLEDVMPSRLRRAQDAYAGLAPTSGPGTLRLVSTVEDAVRHAPHEAQLAIDFVPDELESKLEIFSLLDRMAPPNTILCTPSSALSIADLASCTYRPQLCFALRLPNPQQAELIHTQHSSPEALRSVERWLADLGFIVSTSEDRAEAQLLHSNR